jgi:hypothetical protein
MNMTPFLLAAGAFVLTTTSAPAQRCCRFPPPSATPFVETIRHASGRLELQDLASPTHVGRELRLWYGFGLFGVRLLILRENQSKWRAFGAYPVDRAPTPSIAALPDSSDWACRWQAALNEGLLQLRPYPRRDSTTIRVNDGYSAVIEWFDGARYGISGADNPGSYGSPDDRHLLRVLDAVLDDGAVPRCSRPK